MTAGNVFSAKESAPKLAIRAYHREEDDKAIRRVVSRANPAYVFAGTPEKIHGHVPGARP